jgi:hypothetical protein
MGNVLKSKAKYLLLKIMHIDFGPVLRRIHPEDTNGISFL